jgi:hypothetical protein
MAVLRHLPLRKLAFVQVEEVIRMDSLECVPSRPSTCLIREKTQGTLTPTENVLISSGSQKGDIFFVLSSEDLVPLPPCH